MYIEQIREFMDENHSPFHNVNILKEYLAGKGFIELKENANFILESNKAYFVTRNNTSIIAFKTPNDLNEIHFQIASSHSDSPTFKIKPQPLVKKGDLMSLNVEPYGGMIMSTWLDRPLSISGRVLVKHGNKVDSYLLDVDKNLLYIPNVCIHFNRDCNSGYKYNPAVDLIPMLGIKDDSFDFNLFLLEQLGLDDTQNEVLSHDLFLYNREKSQIVGLNDEFLSAGRIDNLTSVYSSFIALSESECPNNTISLAASFDHEEIGSLSRQGANSTFLKDILSRIVKSFEYQSDDFEKIISKSMMLSIDNAHGINPNHPEYTDMTSIVNLGKGIVIKYNANQNYTTDALSSSLVKLLVKSAHISAQEFTNRSDMRGGSTLGRLSQSEVSMVTADIGVAQLAMHSSYEICAISDVEDMVDFCKEFYNRKIVLDDDSISIW